MFLIVNCPINLKSSGFQHKHPKKKAQKFKVTVLNLQFHTLIAWSIYYKFYYKISNFDTLDSQEFDPISQICYGYD